MIRMMLFLIAILFFNSCSVNRYAVRYEPPIHPPLPAEVLHVVDGDTILVLASGATNSVRFLFIDTPESSANVKLERNLLQYFGRGTYVKKEEVTALGKMASGHLSDILHPGEQVVLEFPSGEVTDKYGRMLALVFINGTNVNYLMVKDGYAATYFLGSSTAPALRFYRKLFLSAEETARKRSSGIWKTLK